MRIVAGISVLCFALWLAGCRKDTSDQQTPLVQDVVIDGNNCTINFTYDNLGRLSTIMQCDTTETYTYFKDSVTDIRMANGTLAYKNSYQLNGAGRATSYTRLGGDGSVAYYRFSYDAEGHRLATTDTADLNTTDSFMVQNGNVVAEVSSSSVNLNGNYTVATTYYASTINRLSNANFGLGFLGTSSVNLKKTDAFNNQQGQYTVTYTYVLDNDNGIAQRVSTLNGTVTETRSYEYY